jgi:HEAT repeat protein
MNIPSRHSACFFFFNVTSVLLLGTATLAADEPRASDPVEGLAAVLRTPLERPTREELDARRRSITKCAATLQSPTQLQRALMLDNWRDADQDPRLSEIDREARTALAHRFERSLQMALRSGDRATQLACAALIAEVGVPASSPISEIGRGMAKDLVESLKESNDPQFREATARVLGKIYADPAVAVPALERLLKSRMVSDRRGAAAGLDEMVHTIVQLRPPLGVGGFTLTAWDAAKAAALAATAASKGLEDDDPEARRLSARAIRGAALVLSRLVPEPEQPNAGLGGRVDKPMTPAEVKSLAIALKEQGSNLGRRLDDANISALLAANEALEAIAEARLRSRLLRETEKSSKDVPIDELIGEGLRSALPGLGKELSHKEVRVRLAALYVLETLETEAAPVADPVVEALKDSNSFVRWGAVRTLGQTAPLKADKAAPALALLIDDRNGDVRGSVLQALARYGRAAKAAVPALTRALAAPDEETQVLSARALGSIGADAGPAVPALIKALAASESEVRVASAQALGKIGPPALSASQALQKALNDPDNRVRQAATDALFQIQPQPNS